MVEESGVSGAGRFGGRGSRPLDVPIRYDRDMRDSVPWVEYVVGRRGFACQQVANRLYELMENPG